MPWNPDDDVWEKRMIYEHFDNRPKQPEVQQPQQNTTQPFLVPVQQPVIIPVEQKKGCQLSEYHMFMLNNAWIFLLIIIMLLVVNYIETKSNKMKLDTIIELLKNK
jgi:hypothetical protein